MRFVFGRPLFAAALFGIFAIGCGHPAQVAHPGPEHSASSSTAETTPAAKTVAPARVLERREVVPGKLWVTVYAHEFPMDHGKMPLWTYVTEGLWPLHQKEIVFSVKRETNENEGDFPQDFFQLNALIYDFAAKGQFVDIQGSSRLGGKGLLGRADFLCVAYNRPVILPGIQISQPHLAASVVTCDEMDVAEKFGFTRLYTRLGARALFFPTPFWTDRQRESVATKGELDSTALAKLARFHLPHASVRLERKGGLTANIGKNFFVPGDKVVLRLVARSAASLRRDLPAKSDLITLMLEMDRSAGQAFVWFADQTSPAAITCSGKTDNVTANFLTLGKDDKEAFATLVEDGYVLTFLDDEWQRLRKAMLAGQTIVLPARGNRPEFRIEVAETIYVSPVDGMRYETEDGFTQYQPEGGVVKRNAQVESSIVLLTSEEELVARTTAEDLAGVAKAILAAVDEEVGDKPGPASDFAVECEIKPGKSIQFDLAQRPKLDKPFSQAVYQKLQRIKAPEVKGPVKFQVVSQIRGGATAAK